MGGGFHVNGEAGPDGLKLEAGTPKIEARRAERGEFLGEGMFRCPPARRSGQRCKLAQWDPERSLATWRFRMSYRLTNPLLVSTLLLLNSFQ